MPVSATYPGVYVEEIPSGVRSLTGVGTSITAFIGHALRGPVSDPVRITQFADFERIYGGLWLDSTLGYAVQQFFVNGGTDAVVVRVAHTYGSSTSIKATHAFPATSGALDVEAVSEGAWGNKIFVTITHNGDGTFNMVVRQRAGTLISDTILRQEIHNNLKVTSGDPRYVVDVMATDSELIRIASPIPTTIPLDAAETALTGGLDADRTTKASHNYDAPDGNPSNPQVMIVQAVNEGAWGNNILIKITHNDDPTLPNNGTFNMFVREHAGQSAHDPVLREEIHYNLSVNPASDRYVAGVLEHESELVNLAAPYPTARPDETLDVSTPIEIALAGGNDGAFATDADYIGSQSARTGMFALEEVDLFNILCIPPIRRGTAAASAIDVAISTWSAALAYCKNRRAMLIVDPPETWTSVDSAIAGLGASYSTLRDENAALYFPRVLIADELQGNALTPFVGCGAIAGIMSRTDAVRGVWKAPAGTDANIVGAQDLTVNITDADSGRLNPLAINAIRRMPAAGIVVWGARTLEGVDQLVSEWKFLSVRRLALYLEESMLRGTQWAVFEPNDESLWAQIRLTVGGFMHNLFRQGAFAGRSAGDSYFVLCDGTTTPQEDIDRGVVNVIVGFAPLKPAEFVIVKIQQIAGETAN
jgi:phage tail sheath protein FI